MGADFSAVMAIGYKIDRSDLYTEKQVPACGCGVDFEGAKFCPECGTKVGTKTKKVPVQVYVPDEWGGLGNIVFNDKSCCWIYNAADSSFKSEVIL